jgi:hypothetical protein
MTGGELRLTARPGPVGHAPSEDATPATCGEIASGG